MRLLDLGHVELDGRFRRSIGSPPAHSWPGPHSW
jgi:hypothetical protein